MADTQLKNMTQESTPASLDKLYLEKAAGTAGSERYVTVADLLATAVSELSDLSDATVVTPADAHLLLYDTTGTAFKNVLMSGDVTITKAGVAAIVSGAIINADINAGAAIALSKLATDPLARANHTGTQALATISDSGALAALATVSATEIDNVAVTYAKIQDVGGYSFLARNAATSGVLSEISAATTDKGTPVNGDRVFIWDSEASNAIKTALLSALPGGGGGSVNDYGDIAYAAIEVKTANYTVVSTDAGKLVLCNSASSFTLTLDATSWTAGKFLDIVNINDGDVTIQAGAGNDEGINRAGLDTLTLVKDQRLRMIYRQASDPKWIAQAISFIELGNSQFVGTNASGSHLAYNLKSAISGSIETDTNGTITITYKTPFEIVIDSVDLATKGGTCSVQVEDDAANLTGFSSAVALTTANTNTVAGDTIAKGSELTVIISAAAGLTAVKFALNYTRTGN